MNEQWPGYWARMLESRGYYVIDCMRHRVWNNPEVQWWYAQNMFVFTTDTYLRESPTLLDERKTMHPSQLALVHPRKYLAVTDPTSLSMKTLIRTAATKYRNHIRRRPSGREGSG